MLILNQENIIMEVLYKFVNVDIELGEHNYGSIV